MENEKIKLAEFTPTSNLIQSEAIRFVEWIRTHDDIMLECDEYEIWDEKLNIWVGTTTAELYELFKQSPDQTKQ